MELIETYRRLARSLGKDRFVARHPNLFLVKRPTPGAQPSENPWDDRFSFRTKVLEGEDDADLLDEEGPHAQEWLVVEVKKREGNPFPDRISVGRTKNLDVVLRFPSISKLHAQFLRVPGEEALRLSDQQSVNGTAVNDEPLEPGTQVPVKNGDRVRFGGVHFLVLDAPAFFALLTSS